MKNNDKYVEAKKYLQKRYPKELSDKRWNTSDINDDWVTEMMTDFASQSKPQEINPVDTKTVDAVEFLHWVRENDFVYSGGAGWYKDEFDIVIVNALTYITDAELLNLYIESKK